MSDTKRLWLMVLLALWVLAWGGSVVAFAIAPLGGDGPTRGTNRAAAFLGWQGVASVIAVAVCGLGRGWPKDAAVRRLSRIPMVLAALLALAIGALVAWARLGA